MTSQLLCKELAEKPVIISALSAKSLHNKYDGVN